MPVIVAMTLLVLLLYCCLFFLFIDIAISAPFEGSGVVYIFNGRVGSVNTKYSQKIIGKNIHPGIMSFGLFISESRDMDANGFPGKAH